MDVNRYKLIDSNVNKSIVLPLDINWDFLDRGDSVDIYQQEIVDKVIGEPVDYELARFTHALCGGYTKLTYKFNFWNSTDSSYENSYVVPNLFNPYQLFYETSPIKKTFFKMDLYDSNDPTNQRIYLSVILTPKQTTITELRNYESFDYNVKIPKFELDYIGEREGFFIYFFEDTKIIDKTDLYMSAKMFNGLTGEYIKFSSVNQNNQGNPNNFNPALFFFKVQFNYNDKTYKIINPQGAEVCEIEWFQYVNKE
jgi:hypothetical protein